MEILRQDKSYGARQLLKNFLPIWYMLWSCVCLSVCPSVTIRYCTKIAKPSNEHKRMPKKAQ